MATQAPSAEANATAPEGKSSDLTGSIPPTQKTTAPEAVPVPPSHTNGAAAASVPAVSRPILTRDSYNYQSFGRALNAHVKQARVLMVGAGGIGCELLKNLVLSGFGEIEIVDLDTIDLSNLNRQFLFRHEHIKKPKALVAKEVAQKFNPNVSIVAHHANIKDSQFTVTWFRRFRLVFNALDNLEARRHVNKMCLAAQVPLVESGTTGFNGQVQVIQKGVTACYDCTPKETPKTFPVCTIRSTPSQPIHCIVWGKSYLLNEMFGASEDQAAFDHSADAANAEEIAELKKESDALRKIRSSIGSPDFPKLLFDKVFNADIRRLLSMEDMWKSRDPPKPLEYDALAERSANARASTDKILKDDQKVWSEEESFAVFEDSLKRLSKRAEAAQAAKGPSDPELTIEFDKDDEDTLDFVAASANIRSALFGIERKSRFDIKQMAGNIIPAIATTNAIVAGLCVLQAFKVLKGDFTGSKEVFLTPFSSGRLLASDRPRPPNPDCPVCSVYQTSVTADLERATLNDIVEDVVKSHLGYGDKDFVVNNEVGILYDADETENLSKKLSDLGIGAESFLTIVDEDDDEPFVNVVINIQAADGSSSDKPIQLDDPESINIPKKPKKEAISQTEATNGTSLANGKHNADDLDIAVNQPAKRARTDDVDGQPAAKKAKVDEEAQKTNETDAIVIDDSAGGAIVIDDD